MKTRFLAILLVVFFLIATSAAAPKTYIFSGTIDEAFDAAVRVIQANWSMSYADRKTATLSFNTGTSFTSNGMECSAALEQVQPGQVRMTLKTQKKNGQVIAWGVGDRIASKLFKGIDAELAKYRTAGDSNNSH